MESLLNEVDKMLWIPLGNQRSPDLGRRHRKARWTRRVNGKEEACFVVGECEAYFPCALVQHFDEHDLSNRSVPADVLGRAYEYLIKQFADDAGAKAGEFFTPPDPTFNYLNFNFDTDPARMDAYAAIYHTTSTDVSAATFACTESAWIGSSDP